jgi:hypothetical protein
MGFAGVIRYSGRFDQKCKGFFFALPKGRVLCRNVLFLYRFVPKLRAFSRFFAQGFLEFADLIEWQNFEGKTNSNDKKCTMKSTKDTKKKVI